MLNGKPDSNGVIQAVWGDWSTLDAACRLFQINVVVLVYDAKKGVYGAAHKVSTCHVKRVLL